MADQKKAPVPPILNIFSQKFHGLVLWLVGLIGHQCDCVAVRRKLKNRQKVHFLSLHRTASRPYRLSHTKTNVLHSNQLY